MKALQVNATWAPRDGYQPTKREEREKRAISGTKIWKDPVLELVDKPKPQPKDDEVLLKIGGTGVCGSDTIFMHKDEDGYVLFSTQCKLPCTLGHEFSGEVVEIGKNVTEYQVGDLVTAEMMNWCGRCAACRMGMPNQCVNREEVGFTEDGGFAEYLTIKEKYCLNINGFVNTFGSKQRALEVGALVEPTTIAYNAIFIRGGGFLPGGCATVFGCGPVGLAGIALLRAAGASKIIAFDLSEARLRMAKDMGADHVFNPIKVAEEGKSPSDYIMELTNGEGAAMQLEVTEAQKRTIPEIEKAIAIRGKVVQIGLSAEKTPISALSFQMNGASYHGTNGGAGHGIWSNVIKLISSGRLDISKMISGCYSLDNALDAFNESKKGNGGKYVITPHW